MTGVPVIAPRYTYCGLLFACPVDQTNPADCQLHGLRLTPSEDRLKHWFGLTDAQRLVIIGIHRECLSRKDPL